MKNKLFYALLVTMFTACTLPEGVNDNGNTLPSRPDYIFCSFEEDTRVELNKKMKTVWSEGDQVICFSTGILDTWNYVGQTGEQDGTFESLDKLSPSDDYNYGGLYYALYPYASYAGFAYSSNGAPSPLHIIQPVQNYKPDTYDPESNIMLGTSENGEEFIFRNLMGYINIPLTGDKCVSKITIQGNNNETLNGKRSFIYNKPEIGSWIEDTTKITTLICNESVQLSTKATKFYITLVPTEFKKGITLVIHFSDQTKQTITLENKITIERNRILNLNNINIVEPEPEPEPKYDQFITIQHHGSKIYAPAIYGDSGLEGWIYLDDGYMFPVGQYNEFYTFNDNKTSHTIEIEMTKAYMIVIGSCMGISEIDLSKF